MFVRKSFGLVLCFVLAASVFFGAAPAVGGGTASAAEANRLDNPGFETGTTDGWLSMGTATLTATTAQKYAGAYSALVSGRQDTWNGISQNLLPKATPGKVYDVVGRIRLANASSGEVKLTMRSIDGSGTNYATVAQANVTDSAWTELRGAYTFNPSGTATDLLLYVEGLAATVNFYVDEFVVTERTLSDWKADANARIEQIRKRDAVISVVDADGAPVAGAAVQVNQTKHKFGFGSAINTNVLSNSAYASFFKSHFEWATFENEAKWYYNEPSQGNVTYTDADRILAWTEANGISVHGHNVFWEVQNNVPSWVQGLSGTALKQAVDNRLNSAVTHFKGKFPHWDVNNEMLHGSFFKDKLGASIWPYMYQRTRELDPNAKLFVNDYNVIEYAEDNNYKQQIQSLLNQGAPIDGIGVQGHFGASIDPTATKTRLDNLSTLGLPIWITEFDSTTPDASVRADNLEMLYRIAFSEPSVDGIIMWGFWAGSHWRGAEAAIVNQDWTLNAAGQRFEALMKEWTTKTSGATDSQGHYDFRGFHGTYDVTVTAPGAAPVTKTFVLEPGETPFAVSVAVSGGGSGPVAPAAPSGLTAAAGDAQATLAWTASAGAAGYNVKRAAANGGPYTTVAPGVTGVTFTDTGLTNGTTYYYVVSAVNAAGESANSAQASVTPAGSGNPGNPGTLSVQYKLANANATDNSIYATFNIKNTGTAAVNLSDLKLRYYLTKEGSANLNFYCDYAQIGTSRVSGSFAAVSPAKTGADTVLEISLGAAAGTIAAGGQSGDIQVRVAKADWSNFNEANDYSFDGTKTAYADWSKVTLYQGGTLVWGVEP